jgi:hypothetical protein
MREVEVQCPACDRAVASSDRTCECGWTLHGPLRIGPVTGKMREDFEAELNRRWRARDAHVVARITADPGPYQEYIRGGPPDAAEWQAARQAAGRDLAGASDENALLAGLRSLLGELRPGHPITIVEVDANGISMIRADLDRFGSPLVSGAGQTATWESMLGMLSGKPEERRFQLAGGMSRNHREQARDNLDRQMPAMPDGPLHVICRVAGWEVPERMAAKAAARPGARLLRATGTADTVPVRDLLADLAATTPLKREYRLMIAVIAPDSGAVSVQTRTLFAMGDPPGTQSSLPLRRLPGGDPDMALAIFAGDTPAADPLTLYRVQAPVGTFTLRAELHGPGRVQILEPGGAENHPLRWDEIRGEIPSRVDTALGPVDLVCAIDLSGASEPRRKLARKLLTLLSRQYGESSWLRVGMVTCTEHVFERGARGDPVTDHLELGPPGKAAAWLEGKEHQPRVKYPDLAPVEDLLHDAFTLLRDSRDAGRAAILVTLAGRPPHPWPQLRDSRLPCPNRFMWAEEIGKLTGRAGARCVMVTDDAAAGVEGVTGWQKLGPGGLCTLADTTPRRLAEYLGLIARQGQRFPLPLPENFQGGLP